MRALLLFRIAVCFTLFTLTSVAYAETYGDPLHYQLPKPVPIARTSTEVSRSSGPVFSSKVNINTADAATLDKRLKGVGAAKAKAIVDYRNAHGPFQAVDELIEVKGIGPAIWEKNSDVLTIN
ncbi:ComEA family DNA-binding protein [Pseudomonas sp. JZ134]|uniref:ComEA family DNA-binding protein n=1 Tax=Pseudomonas sp. JZ134 TaxID=2806615 RepID=UPI003DA144BE